MMQNESLFPLGEKVPLIVLLSVETLSQLPFFNRVANSLRGLFGANFGYDVRSATENVSTIYDALQRVGIVYRVWIGDGSQNCAPRAPSTRIKEILAKRNTNPPAIRIPLTKVYAWTVNDESTMRQYLQIGVDALVVNMPDTLQNMIESELHESLSLASNETDPWQPIPDYEVAPPLARGCDRRFLNRFCWQYTSPDKWCWTKIKCGRVADCWGNLSCL